MFMISRLPNRRALAVAAAIAATGMGRSTLEAATFVPADCQMADGRMFTDVPFDHPYCAWAEQLARDGITNGCDLGRYCPNEPVTRAQLAQLLEKVMRGTDSWFSAPRVEFFCQDPGSDCSEAEGEFIDVAMSIRDSLFPTDDHLVHLWFTAAPQFSTVSAIDGVVLPGATALDTIVPNGRYRVLTNGYNQMTAMLVMNSAATRYIVVELGGRLFKSPPLTWTVGPT